MSTNMICAACGVQNRVPEARLADKPICGQCRKPLFGAKPFEVDGVSLERHVVKDDVPVLLDCWAAWCGPCQAMAPQFEAAAGLIAPNARLAKLDTEADPQAASRLQIRSIPTLILFAGGREIARTTGAMDARSIVRWTEQRLAQR